MDQVMPNKQSELSVEMYHRLYKLIKRKIDPRSIAATLNLPLKTVNNIISRIEQSQNEDQLLTNEPERNSFLDVYFISKIRYGIIQLVGKLISQNIAAFEKELEKATAASWKAIAIQLTDVQSIDNEASALILKYSQKFSNLGRFLALLDPSPDVEQDLIDLNLESSIPIFGTERAFEDAAFSKRSMFNKKGGNL